MARWYVHKCGTAVATASFAGRLRTASTDVAQNLSLDRWGERQPHRQKQVPVPRDLLPLQLAHNDLGQEAELPQRALAQPAPGPLRFVPPTTKGQNELVPRAKKAGRTTCERKP